MCKVRTVRRLCYVEHVKMTSGMRRSTCANVEASKHQQAADSGRNRRSSADVKRLGFPKAQLCLTGSHSCPSLSHPRPPLARRCKTFGSAMTTPVYPWRSNSVPRPVSPVGSGKGMADQ